jgi:hypothetical protein
VAAAQLRHGGRAIDGGRDDQALDGAGKRSSWKRKPAASPDARRFHAAARRARLVEESHVALVGQLAGGIEAETGKVQRQPGTGEAQLHGIARDEAGQRQALPLDQVFHGIVYSGVKLRTKAQGTVRRPQTVRNRQSMAEQRRHGLPFRF